MEAAVGERQPVDLEAERRARRAPRPSRARPSSWRRRRRAEPAVVAQLAARAAAPRSRASAATRSRDRRAARPRANCCALVAVRRRAAARRSMRASPLPHSLQARAALLRVRARRRAAAGSATIASCVAPSNATSPVAQQHRAVAEPLDRRRVVRDEDDRAAALLELEDLAEALALELPRRRPRTPRRAAARRPRCARRPRSRAACTSPTSTCAPAGR